MPKEGGELADARRMLDELDALLGPPVMPAPMPGKTPRRSRVRSSGDGGPGVVKGAQAAARAARARAEGLPGGRRRRRWGAAARAASKQAKADGTDRGARSLRAVREGFPLSQSELADRAGVARATLQLLESGKRHGHPVTRRAIARALRVEVGELLW